MQKTLTPLGNSLALVIEKPFRRLLGISQHTVLEVSCDGRRLIVEPLSVAKVLAQRAEEGELLDAKQTAFLFDQKYCMTNEQFTRLTGEQGPYAFARYLMRVDRPNPSPEMREKMARMAECLRYRQAGKGLDEAISMVLRARGVQGE